MKREYDVTIIPNEDDKLEYKEIYTGTDLAKEIVGLANARGGTIKIGITDDKKIVGVKGITPEDIINMARQNCIPAIIPNISTENHGEKEVIRVDIPMGNHPPYRTNNGNYKIRVGPSIRDVTLDELIDLIIRGPHKGTILLRAVADDLQSTILAAVQSGEQGTQDAKQGIMKLIGLITKSTSEKITLDSIIILESISKSISGYNNDATEIIIQQIPLLASSVIQNPMKKQSRQIVNKLIDILEQIFWTITIVPKDMDLIKKCLTSLYRIALCSIYSGYAEETRRTLEIIEKEGNRPKLDKYCKKALSMIAELPSESYIPQRMGQFFQSV